MALQTATNVTAPRTMRWADNDGDPYDRETQLAAVTENFDGHDHTAGKGKQVPTGGIADLAVTTAKIADANVTTAKIADLNVTTGKIAAAAVDASKLANDAVVALWAYGYAAE